MNDMLDSAGSVRKGEELDTAGIERFLAEQVPALPGPVRVTQFPGGHSNLTYLLTVGDQPVVLRRPPFGTKVKSAHDMGREYRILAALSPNYSRAPKPIAHTEDEQYIGAPFYLMQRVEGVILRKEVPGELNLDATRFRQLCENLVDALAELHSLNYEQLGLAGMRREGSYVERQVTGWTKRYFGSQTDDVPVIEEVAAWLAQNMPADAGASLIHNDFKLDNVVLDPRDPTQIIGVLDWEMSTIGCPLMDLGTFISYWVQSDDDDVMQLFKGQPSDREGALTRDEIVHRYAQKVGREPPDPRFYYCFGLFKTAIVVQQIYYRYKQGLTKDERFALFGAGAEALCQQAAKAMRT